MRTGRPRGRGCSDSRHTPLNRRERVWPAGRVCAASGVVPCVVRGGGRGPHEGVSGLSHHNRVTLCRLESCRTSLGAKKHIFGRVRLMCVHLSPFLKHVVLPNTSGAGTIVVVLIGIHFKFTIPGLSARPCSLGQASSTGRCAQSYDMYVESDHTRLWSRY